MMTREQLLIDLKAILHDFSGGIKFTELLVELNKRYRMESLDPDFIESTIRDCSELGLLEYGWDMGSVIRTKMFVFTPLKP